MNSFDKKRPLTKQKSIPLVSFREPLISRLAAGEEEQIYGFSRRCVCSPEITGNSSLRCCAVNGPPGAQSTGHTHPGDEVVISLHGENLNSVAGASFTLQEMQAIAVPPETLHSTRVTGNIKWKGVSFYCDDCPFIREARTDIVKSQTTIKPLSKPLSCSGSGLHGHVLFSPSRSETTYMRLALFWGAGETCCEMRHPGEAVYIPLHGLFKLLWQDGERLLQPGMAAVIPAGFGHMLAFTTSSGARFAVCSCSCCCLAGFSQELD